MNGLKLRELRIKNGMSQNALAKKLGVSRTAVSKWENTGAYPRGKRINILATLLGCDPNIFFADEVKK